MFEYSTNWGGQLLDSLWWITWVTAATAAVTLIVLALLLRLTKWGRQFWRISGDYFWGRHSIGAWVLAAMLLISVVASVRLDVLLTYNGSDTATGLQIAFQGQAAGDPAAGQSGQDGFWGSLRIFAVLATIHVVRTMVDIYLMQLFIIRWRVWLTHKLTGQWLDNRAYYRGRFNDKPIDNPDQRIQQDVDIFTTGFGTTWNLPSYGSGSVLLLGAISSVLSILSFGPILWNLSGPLDVAGVTIPHALFWIAIGYVLLATVIAFWIGKPLARLSFINEARNAAFRYALVRLRDMGEAVAFYRGERTERAALNGRFGPLIDNYRHYVYRTIGFSGWNLSASQAAVPLGYLIQAPRMFAGEISYGQLSQSSTATSNIMAGLSFFRNAYDNFAAYRAAITRLDGLVDVNEKARLMEQLPTVDSTDGAVELDSVTVSTPTGEPLVTSLSVRLEPGDSLVITGESGVGKSTLLRSLAGLWPYASGTLTRPGGENETMFASQVPYVPLGSLRAVVSYPLEPGAVPDDKLREVLAAVQLPHLVDRLDDDRDWVKVLSPGEQQRIAFARVLLLKPKALLVDEATAALDPGLEFTMYTTLRTELPELILASVSHRDTLLQHHRRELKLLGGGEWQINPVEQFT